jgi:hypothetical protein
MWATSLIFLHMPKANNHPLGKSSPKLVTLILGDFSAQLIRSPCQNPLQRQTPLPFHGLFSVKNAFAHDRRLFPLL